MKAWVLDGHDLLPPLSVREYWRWKALLRKSAIGRAQETRRRNPEWYS
jgi:hypothetical protein